MAFPQLNHVWPVFARGGTVVVTSNFFDAFNHALEPNVTPQVNFSFTNMSTGLPATALITMVQNPNGSWSAYWDSRGAAPGVVYWSVETPGSPPVSVEDGQFTLEANAANQVTF